MSRFRPKLPDLRPIDYLFLIGGPVLFFLIAVVGLRAIVGPIPQPNPVQRIRDGEFKSGDNLTDVLKKLGAPKSITTNPDGSMTVIYTRTVADGDLQIEEGVLTVDSTGHIVETHVDRQLPTKPTTSTTQ